MVSGYHPPQPGPLQPGLTAEYSYRDGAQAEIDWFRFGDGYLGLRCEHAGFRARFVDLFVECRADPPAASARIVHCSITMDNGRAVARVTFDDPEPFDQVPFALESLATSGYVEAPSAEPGRRTLRSATTAGELSFDDHGFVADLDSPWPTITGPIAVHRVLRLQRDVMFFHAAAVGIGGRGVLLMGPREAGKTTLSLALAECGHQFFSDEMTAVRRETLEILPFRRRLSIRPGPSAPGVRETLDRRTRPVIDVGDGTLRTRAQPAEFGPAEVAVPVIAQAIVFLGAKGEAARTERFTPTPADLRLLSPYESAAWGQPPALVALGLMRLLGRVRCYHLALGPIDETTRRIEALAMEE